MSSPAGCSWGVPDETKIKAFADILVKTDDERVRTVLLKISACESYSVNTKALSSSSAPELQATLMFLRGSEDDTIPGEILELLKTGLVHHVLLEVNKLLPYKCNSCANNVENQILEKHVVQCRGCGIGACVHCFPAEIVGWSFMCNPCGTNVDSKRKTPLYFLTSKGRKKSARENALPVEEVSNEEIVTMDDLDEQDETDYIPLGQGTPRFQSTQAGASATAVSESNDFFLDTTSQDVTTVVGSGDTITEASLESSSGSAETVGETNDDFILPPKRAKAAAKLKQKQATKEKDAQSVTANVSGSAICRFFLKGCCKFGFFGKGKLTQGKCPFIHPKTCKRFMDNGTEQGGCSRGKSCSYAHPKMCPQSLASRTCPNIKDGLRCTAGYHVRGTRYSATKPLGDNNISSGKPSKEAHSASSRSRRENNSSSYVPPVSSFPPVVSVKPAKNVKSLGDQQAVLTSVFHEIIRAEVVKLLQTGSLWPQPTNQSCGPVVPSSTTRGPDTTTPIGNLGALLSLLGAQQH
jgi:hypothetical protein